MSTIEIFYTMNPHFGVCLQAQHQCGAYTILMYNVIHVLLYHYKTRGVCILDVQDLISSMCMH